MLVTEPMPCSSLLVTPHPLPLQVLVPTALVLHGQPVTFLVNVFNTDICLLQRFNVSITRAQALLIVVGNPHILRHDKHWYQLLKYCKDNSALVGETTSLEDPPENQPEHVAG